MKVLHLTEGLVDGDGGTISLNRLHCGLKDAGVQSQVLCTAKWPIGAPDDIIKLQAPRIGARATQYLKNISRKVGLEGALDPTHREILTNRAFLDADVLTMHNIYGSCSYLGIPAITQSKPTVFVLRDMMSFTGHCFHSLDCERWKTGCGKCPYPNTFPAITVDNTRLAWKLKNWSFSRSRLAIVAQSTWMVAMARQSMLSRFPIHHIPNGIDTEVYQPRDQELCRSVLNIPKGKKVLMFMVTHLTSRLKGGDLFIKAVQGLPKSLKADTVILLLGRQGEKLANSLGMQSVYLGYVGSDLLKVMCYSAADCFVSPTRAESFPNVLLESIACGTPVVSQRVGGVPDLARHQVTGLLSNPEDVEGFRNHIIELLENETLRSEMRQHCRRIALEEYSVDRQAQRYIGLYQQVLNGSAEVKP
ncbi:MAG: glycosyltransferase [Nitrospira sp. BO4]|jgi:glycosyltransferase involved in cell wall biosynthesis|nr:glycosyltransferase [Nitrospira sp. BO4]